MALGIVDHESGHWGHNWSFEDTWDVKHLVLVEIEKHQGCYHETGTVKDDLGDQVGLHVLQQRGH
jgi:hypothetical protein